MKQTLSESTSVNELVSRLVAFRDARGWEQFHTVKDLAISVSVEAAELLELAQWKSESQLTKATKQSPDKTLFEDEIADVFIYLLLLCDKLSIDPVASAKRKIDKNETRFKKGTITEDS